jgi:hypothetical protein
MAMPCPFGPVGSGHNLGGSTSNVAGHIEEGLRTSFLDVPPHNMATPPASCYSLSGVQTTMVPYGDQISSQGTYYGGQQVKPSLGSYPAWSVDDAACISISTQGRAVENSGHPDLLSGNVQFYATDGDSPHNRPLRQEFTAGVLDSSIVTVTTATDVISTPATQYVTTEYHLPCDG